jgi:hypothetical protein
VRRHLGDLGHACVHRACERRGRCRNSDDRVRLVDILSPRPPLGKLRHVV